MTEPAETDPPDPFAAQDVPMSVLGMELDAEKPDHPIAALVVVKCMEPNGELSYRIMTTDGVSAIEVMGMADLVQIHYTDMIRSATVYRDSDDEDGPDS